jgi:hypothetical protein
MPQRLPFFHIAGQDWFCKCRAIEPIVDYES